MFPSESIAVGANAKYSFDYSPSGSEWIAYYNNTEIGYFPESIWGGRITQAGRELAYREVSSASASTPCEQMGKGISGNINGSASISNFNIINGSIDSSVSGG